MNVRRFFGKSTREAMAKVRAELGADAIVLKNRAVPGGIEILAMADDPLPDMAAAMPTRGSAAARGRDADSDGPLADDDAPPPAAPRPVATARERATGPDGPQRTRILRDDAASDEPAREAAPAVRGPLAQAAEASAMSTLSFQQFVRERLLRRTAPAEAQPSRTPPAQAQAQALPRAELPKPAVARAEAPQPPNRGPVAPRAAAAPLPPSSPDRHPQEDAYPEEHDEEPARMMRPAAVAATPRAREPMRAPAPVPAAPAPRVVAPNVVPSLGEVLGSASRPAETDVMAELRSMRGLIANQLSSIAWYEGVKRNPTQARLLRRMIGCGISGRLARQIVGRMPVDYSDEEADRWLAQGLSRLIRSDAAGETLIDRGGIYALVGPTGVGKTTSAAKIAARFALRHGVQSIGLLTVDAYRLGAQDQLRAYGRLLGVPVHVAHDAAGLAEFLHLFMNKKLVLIDTVGVAQRDERVGELLASLSSPTIRKLVVLNASAQAETLEDVVSAYRATQAAGVIVSKVDEAVKTGGVVDCLIRHRLRLVGVADGQRVPEDWQQPDPSVLVARTLAARASSAFDLDDEDVALMIADAVTPGARRTPMEKRDV